MSLVNSFGNMVPLSLDIANENSEPHWLYDLSIEDVEARKKKRQWFAAAHKLANYLGVPPRDVFNKRVPGTKIFSNRFQRWYAIRIVTKRKSNEQKDSTC